MKTKFVFFVLYIVLIIFYTTNINKRKVLQKMAVFRSFWRILKGAIFASIVLCLPVFSNVVFADSANPDYFAVKITPEEKYVSGTKVYTFSFSLSAAGCYDILWDCDSENDDAAACGLTQSLEAENLSGINSKLYNQNTAASSFYKATIGNIDIEKRYPDRNSRVVIFKRADNCVYGGYSKEAGAIVFSGAGSGSVNNNTAVEEIYGSLGAVFPTLSKIYLGADVDNEAALAYAQTQPSFEKVFNGCTELGGTIPETLFKGLTGSPSNAMFASAFSGCKYLTGTIPPNLFKNVSGAITQSMFNNTFQGCTSLSGDIPEGLFDNFSNFTQKQMFYRTFAGCTGLTGVPANLFRNFGGINRNSACREFEDMPAESQPYSETFSGCSNIKYLFYTDNDGKHTINYIPRKFFGDVCIDTNRAAAATAGMFLGVPAFSNSEGIIETGANYTSANANCESLSSNLKSVETDNAQNGKLPRILNGLYSNASDATNSRKAMCVGQDTPVEKLTATIEFYSNCYNNIDANYVQYSHVNTNGIYGDDTYYPASANDPIYTMEVYEGGRMYNVGKSTATGQSATITRPSGCNGYAFKGYYAVTNCGSNVINTSAQYFDRFANPTNKSWNTVFCKDGVSVARGTDDAVPYVQLYGLWGPQIYKITLDDDIDTNNSRKSVSHTYGMGTIYEKYLTGMYPQNAYNLEQDEITDSSTELNNKVTVPSVYAWKFLGYYNGTQQVIDKNGNIVAPEYVKKSIQDDITLLAHWEKQTEIDFRCNDKNTGTKIQTSSVVNENFDQTKITTNGSNITVFDIIPSDSDVFSKCKYNQDEHKEIFWQCVKVDANGRETPVYVYDDNGVFHNSLVYSSGAFQVKCWTKYQPKVYTLNLLGNNGTGNDHSTGETSSKLYIQYDIENYVNRHDPNQRCMEGYFKNYNPKTRVVSDEICGIDASSTYVPHNPSDNIYGKYNGFYTARENGENKILPPNDTTMAYFLPIDAFDGDTTLYAQYIDTTTTYGLQCMQDSNVSVEDGVVTNSHIVTGDQTKPKYGIIDENKQPFDTHTICHTTNSAYWKCTKKYNANRTDGVTSEDFCYIPNNNVSYDASDCGNNVSVGTIITDGSVDSVNCYSSEDPAIYDIILQGYNYSGTDDITIQEVYGDKFYGLDSNNNKYAITNITSVNQNVLNTRCASDEKFVGYYRPDLLIASNGKIIMDASTFEERTYLGPSCIDKNKYNVSLFCDSGDTNGISGYTNQELSFSGAYSTPSFPDSATMNKTQTQNTPLCAEAQDKVYKGEWICTKYTLNSGEEPAYDPFNYISSTNWLSNITSTDKENSENSLYKINCHPKWEDNTFVINLNLGAAANASEEDVSRGTEQLFGVYATGLYYNAFHTLPFDNNNATGGITEPSWTNHLFNGYKDINGNLIIEPKRLENQDSIANYDDLIYSLYDVNLTAYWTQIYKITLDNGNQETDENSGEESEEINENGLGAIYTDRNLVYANETFTSDNGNGFLGYVDRGIVKIDTSYYGTPLKTGYTFIGYTSGQNGSGTVMATKAADDNRIVFETAAKNVMKTLDNSNTVWYANWTANKYDVDLFQNCDATHDDKVATVEATFDTNMPLTNKSGASLTVPTCSGYTFVGYYDARTNGTQYYGSNTQGSTITSTGQWTTAGTGTLYAHWVPTNYRIDYDTTSMTGASWPAGYTVPTTYTIESDDINIANPSRPFYTFEGWCEGVGNGNCANPSKSVTIPNGSTGNKYFYARWLPITYYISYNLGDATGQQNVTNTSPISYTADNLPLSLVPAVWTGHTFNGWYESLNSDTSISAVTSITDNTPNDTTDNTITLYAKWSDITCVGGQYFDANDNSCKYCPAAYPLSVQDSLDSMTIDKCYSNLTVYDFANKNTALEGPTIHYYTQQYASGIPVSGINKHESDGYELTKWSDETGNIEYNTNSVLAAADGNNTIYGHYNAKEITYRIYCDSNKTTEITENGGLKTNYLATFDMTTYEDMLPTKCATRYNAEDISEWTCVYGNTSETYAVGSTDVSWTGAYHDVISCYANWNPLKIKIVLNYDNNNPENNSSVIYEVYGSHYEDSDGATITRVSLPEYLGHAFTGYCADRQTAVSDTMDACERLISDDGEFVSGKMTPTTYTRASLDANASVNLWAHWVNAYYNIELQNGTGSVGGLEHLYIDNGVFYKESTFENFVGNTTDSTSLGYDNLPLKENYSFAGYTNGNILMVNKDGTLTNAGKSAIDNIANTGNLVWVAQWKSIKTINLDKGADDATPGLEHLYIYSDANDGAGIYKSVVFAEENKIGNTSDVSVSFNSVYWPSRIHYTFDGYNNSNSVKMIDESGEFVSLSAVAALRNMTETETTWTATWARIDCPTGVNTDVDGQYFDSTINDCTNCPSGYPFSDVDADNNIQCYKEQSCDVLTSEMCLNQHPNATTCEYIGDTTWKVYYPNTTSSETHCQIKATGCGTGYKVNANNGTCDPISYTIEFNGNGSNNDTPYTQGPLYYNQSYTLTSNTFEKDGYVFDGWCQGTETCSSNDRIANNAQIGSGSSHLSSTDGAIVQLYAQWKIVNYNVKYYDGNDEITNWTGSIHPATYTTDEQNNIVISSPYKTGYEFLGWCVPPETCDAQHYHNPYTIIKGSHRDINLYAQWNQLNLSYSFKCNSEIENNLSSGTVKTGVTINIPSVNTCPEYIDNQFNGWACATNVGSDAYGNNVSTITPEMSVTSITCIAQWGTPDCRTGSGTVSGERGQYFDAANNACGECPVEYPFAPTGATSINQCYNTEMCDLSQLQCTYPATSCKYKVEGSWNILYGESSRLEDNCIIEDTICDTGYTLDKKDVVKTVIDDETGEEITEKTGETIDVCRPIKYTVKFRSTGSTLKPEQAFSYDETKTLLKNTFTKSKHVFVGWCQSETVVPVVCDEEDIIPDESLVGLNGEIPHLTTIDGKKVYLHAQWEEVNCSDDKYYDSDTNTCKSCPALFPLFDAGDLKSIEDCYTVITVHNNINEDTEDIKIEYNSDYIDSIPVEGSELEEPQYFSGYEYPPILKEWKGSKELSADSEEIDVLPVGVTDVYAVYDLNKLNYTVYCNDNLSSPVASEQQVSYGANFGIGNYKDLVVDECEEAEEQVFNGWSCKSDAYKGKTKTYNKDIENISWTEDDGTQISCYADWRYDTFTVKFDSNGGSGSKADVQCAYDNANCDIANDTATEIYKTGFEFLGWAKDSDATTPDFTDKMTENPAFGESEILLYAVWHTPTNVNLRYVDDDDSLIENTTCQYGEGFTTITPGARSDYEFMGWKNANVDALENIVSGNANMSCEYNTLGVADPVIFSAIWCQKCSDTALQTTTCSVSIDENGQCVYTAACKQGYENITTPVDYDVSCSPASLLIHYDAMGGDLPDDLDNPQEFSVDETVVFQEPVREGYTFTGWYTNRTAAENATSTENIDTTYLLTDTSGQTQDIYLYAGWSEIIHVTRFLCGNGEGVPFSVSVPHHNAFVYSITVPYVNQRCTYAGYPSDGWSCVKDATGEPVEGIIEGQQFAVGEDMTCTAQWQERVYEIIYKEVVNEEENTLTGENLQPTEYVLSKLPLTINATPDEKTGYNFVGWCSEKYGTNCPLHPVITEVSEEPIVFWAEWDALPYTITYMTEGGVLPDGTPNPETYTMDDDVELPVPEKEGYEFMGWALRDSSAFVNQEDAINSDTDSGDGFEAVLYEWDAGTIYSNITLYAKWEKASFKITYHDLFAKNEWEDGAQHPKEYYIDSETFTIGSPKELGYTFDGWCPGTDPECDVPEKDIVVAKGSSGDIDLYAKWTPEIYTITYNDVENLGATWAEDANHPESYTVEYSEFYIDNPIRQGYSFEGWCDQYENCSSEDAYYLVTPGNGADEDHENLILTAQWDIKDYRIEYETFGGTEPVKVSYNIDETPFVLEKPERTGYDFIGWCDSEIESCPGEEQLNKEIVAGTVGDLKFYAQYTPKEYSVNYLCNESDTTPAKSETVEFYAPYTFRKDNSSDEYGKDLCIKTGYTFASWECGYKDANNIVVPVTEDIEHWEFLNDVQCVSIWNENTFNIHFEPNSTYVQNSSEMSDMENCLYEQGCVLTENKYVYPGYKFAGWKIQDSEDTTVYADKATINRQLSDITLEAQWEKGTMCCEAGTYLAHGDYDKCTTCDSKYYCPETNCWEYNAKYDQGILPCKTLMNNNKQANSEPGASKKEECYIPCPAKQNFTLKAGFDKIYYRYNYDDSVCVYEATINYTGNNSCSETSQTYEYSETDTIQLCVPDAMPGQTFLGWQDNAGQTYLISDNPTLSNILVSELTPKYGYVTMTPIVNTETYTLTYDCGVNNKTILVDGLEYNSEETMIDYSECYDSGYSFNGWRCDDSDELLDSGDTFIMPDRDVVCNADIEENRYKIVYDGNGADSCIIGDFGDGCMNETDYISYNEQYNLDDNNFGLRGYDFAGWCSDFDAQSNKCNDNIYGNKQTVSRLYSENDGIITLYAMWTPANYTITYNLPNGATVSPENPSYYYITSDEFTLTNPVLTGYDFIEWCDANNECSLDVKVVPGETIGDLTYTAKMSEALYTITYKYVDENKNIIDLPGIEPSTYTLNMPAIYPDNVYIDGYTFEHWCSDSNLRNITFQADYVPDNGKGITVYAKVKKISCKVNQFIQDNACKPCPEHTRSNGGDATECDCVSGYEKVDGLCEPEEYTITYIYNDGNMPDGVSNPNTYKITDATTLLNAPVKEGSEFFGWYSDNSFVASVPDDLINSDGTVKGDVTLFAVWNEISCDKNYFIQDGVCTPCGKNSTSSGGKATECDCITDYEKINGVCEPKEYTITYQHNGGDLPSGVNNPITYKITDKSTKLKDSVKDDNIFEGWYLTSDFSGNTVSYVPSNLKNRDGTAMGDVTLYAKWTHKPCDENQFLKDDTCVECPLNMHSNGGYATECDCDKDYENIDGVCKPKEYTITYEYNGGDMPDDVENPRIYKLDDENVELKEPEKEDNAFLGWYLNSRFTGNSVSFIPNDLKNSDGTAKGSVTLYAKWKQNPGTSEIVYDCDNGNIIRRSGYIGSDVLVATNEECEITFGELSGWNCNGKEYGLSNKMTIPEKALTCHAIVSYANEEFNIEYRAMDNKGNELTDIDLSDVEPKTFVPSVGATYPENIDIKGYDFKGCFEDRNLVFRTYKTPEYADSDIIVYVKFEIKKIHCDPGTYLPMNSESCDICNEGKYCLGGDFPYSQIVSQGEEDCDPEYPNSARGTKSAAKCYKACEAREHYNYDESGIQYSNGLNTCKYVPITYYINYVLNGGAFDSMVMNPYPYTVETPNITSLPTPNKLGKIFDGWLDSDNNIVTMIDTSHGGNVSLYAKWKPLPCEIGQYVDGEDCKTCPENMSSNGGYATECSCKPGYTDNASTCEPVPYTILYTNLFGISHSNPATYSVEDYGMEFVAPESRDGFEFAGWTKDGRAFNTLIDGTVGDIVLKANWKELYCRINQFIQNNTCVECGEHSHSNGGKTTVCECDEKYEMISGICVPTITYVYNGGAMPNGVTNPTTYTSETPKTRLNDPDKAHHSFEGWYLTSDFSGNRVDYIDSTVMSGPLTLYAKWDFECESDKWFHIGDNHKICLYDKNHRTHPAIAVDIGTNNDNPYYILLSDDKNKPAHAGSTLKMHIEYGGKTYNAHDKSVD